MNDSPILFGDLLVEDNRIKYIGKDANEFAPFDRVIECNGNLIMPGFKNAHSHSGMTFLRSKADDCNLQDWLFKEVFPREEKLVPEHIYHLSKVAILEYISGGITSCLDQYFFPLETKKAAEEMGFRMVVQGTYNPVTNSLESLEHLYKSINEDKNGLVKYAIGFHAEYTASDEEFSKMQQAVRDLKAPFCIHLSETEKEVNECINKRHMSPATFIDSLGLWNYGGVAFHCCYLTDEEIELFKKKNVYVVTCPGSNLKLASGVAPIKRYLNEGLTIGIGTDGPSSNNSLDMFKEMMLTCNLQKLINKDPNAISAYDVLKMATVNGAKILGLDECDTLEVGKLADIIEIDLSRPSMQPINDVINNLVYSGSKDIVKLTMINGKILYEDGKFYLNEDIESIYEKCQEVTDYLDENI